MLNIIYVHSPITDFVRRCWESEQGRCFVVSGRGYHADQSDLYLPTDTLQHLIVLANHLTTLYRLHQKPLVHLLLPHTAIFQFRMLVEHPAVAKFSYIDEGLRKIPFVPNAPYSAPNGPFTPSSLQFFQNAGYSPKAIHRLQFDPNVFYASAHEKYRGAYVAFKSSMVALPNRMETQVNPMPYALKTPNSVLILLEPYVALKGKGVKSIPEHLIKFFNHCKGILKAQNKSIGSVVVSPHPSDFDQNIEINHLVMTTLGSQAELISSFRRRQEIPSWVETGFMDFDTILAPTVNSTVLHNEAVGCQSDFIQL